MAYTPDIVLDGIPYSLYPGSSASAGTNNPPGLRAAGGNQYRDFGAWSEAEFNDFSLGYGQKSMENKGFLVSDADTLHGGIRLGPESAMQELDPVYETYYPYKDEALDAVYNNLKKQRKLFSYLFREMPVSFCTAWGIEWMAAGGSLYFFSVELNKWLFYVQSTNENLMAFRGAIVDMAFYAGHLCLAFGPVFYRQGVADYDDYFKVKAAKIKGYLTHKVDDVDVSYPTLEFEDIGGQFRDYNSNVHGAYVLEVYNGALYALNYNSVYRIVNANDQNLPSPPSEWAHDRFILPTVSSGDESAQNLPDWIVYRDEDGPEVMTGIVSLMSSDGTQMIYVSTSSQLYHMRESTTEAAGGSTIALWFSILKWPGAHYLNGRGAIHHAGDSYWPVDGNVIRVTPTGQLVWVGMQESPVFPVFTYRRHVALSTSQQTLISSVQQIINENESEASMALWNPNFRVRAYALKGQGWHPIDNGRWTNTKDGKEIDTRDYKSSGVFYSARRREVYYGLTLRKATTPPGENPSVDLLVARVPWFEGNSQTRLGIKNMQAYAYTPESTIIFPNFDAGVPMLNKDFNSVEIHGECIGSSTYIDVYVAFNMQMSGCGAEVHFHKDVTWKLLDTIRSEGEFEAHIDCSRAGFPLPAKAMALKLVLHGTSTESPVITHIKYEYWVNIKDYFRFAYSISLPWECLLDRCGDVLDTYEQEEWEEHIRAAVCKTTPMTLVDVDGKRYYVRVESANRRFENLGVHPDKRTPIHDIAWSIVLIQVCPPSLCEATTSLPTVLDATPTAPAETP